MRCSVGKIFSSDAHRSQLPFCSGRASFFLGIIQRARVINASVVPDLDAAAESLARCGAPPLLSDAPLRAARWRCSLKVATTPTSWIASAFAQDASFCMAVMQRASVVIAYAERQFKAFRREMESSRNQVGLVLRDRPSLRPEGQPVSIVPRLY